MTFRHSLAINISPLLLRLLLAVTFIWAGLGKILVDDLTVSRENAPELVDMGAVAQSTVEHLLPPGYVPQNERQAPDADQDANDTGDPDDDADHTDADQPSDPTPPANDTPNDNDGDNDGDDDFFDEPPPSASADLPYRIINARQDSSTEPLTLKRLYGIALILRSATEQNPYPVDSDHAGELMDPIMPEFAGQGSTPKLLAWAVALTEIFAGGFLLLGFLTRLSALALAIVMGTALWLTVIGPAIQTGATHLGFLPDHDPWDMAAWAGPLWQLALMTVSCAVFFSGPGGASLDRLLFGPSGSSDDD